MMLQDLVIMIIMLARYIGESFCYWRGFKEKWVLHIVQLLMSWQVLDKGVDKGREINQMNLHCSDVVCPFIPARKTQSRLI